MSRGRLRYAARAFSAISAQPYEGTQRVRERVDEWRFRRRSPWPYEPSDDGEERLHRLIGARWPCEEARRFEDVWNAAMEELHARRLRVGRGAFGGWDDADIRLARLAWCLTRHLRPARVVETGVGRGVTTRVMLEGLRQNDRGRLWSIDLPPLLEGLLAEETAVAVPERLRDRWTLVRGSSRRVLRGLVGELRQLDLFVHDSMHTTRNVRFELEQAWPALAPDGAALIDDVEKNWATGEFLRSHPGAPAVILEAGDDEALIGCLLKPGRSG